MIAFLVELALALMSTVLVVVLSLLGFVTEATVAIDGLERSVAAANGTAHQQFRCMRATWFDGAGRLNQQDFLFEGDGA